MLICSSNASINTELAEVIKIRGERSPKSLAPLPYTAQMPGIGIVSGKPRRYLEFDNFCMYPYSMFNVQLFTSL